MEGIRAVEEGLDAGVRYRFAVGSDRAEASEAGARLLARLEEAGVPVERVTQETFQGVSDTEHAQGVLAVCPEPGPAAAPVGSLGRYLILDAVQDPGNVGTLVRLAAAFGLDGVWVLDGTADPWGGKAVRASAGTVFRVPLYRGDAEAAVRALRDADVPIVVADAGGVDVASWEPQTGWALSVGNEGAGPRAEILEAARARLAVPMPGGIESLNVGAAGAVLLYSLTLRSVRG